MLAYRGAVCGISFLAVVTGTRVASFLRGEGSGKYSPRVGIIDMRHSRYRRLVWLGAVAVWACLFPGVGTRAYGEPVEVRFWHFLDLRAMDVFGRVIEDFNAAHPGIKVVAEYQGGHDLLVRKIISAIVAGAPPELATVGCSDIPRMADTGWILPMDLSPAEKADIYEAIQKVYTYKDKLWALSIEGATYALFWNKKLFREAGLEMRAPATWDEVIQFGKVLTQDKNGDGKLDQWGFVRSGDEVLGPSTIYNMLFLNNARLINPEGTRVELDAPEVVGALQLWKDLADKHHITEVVLPPRAVKQGKVGIWIGGSWSYTDYSAILDVGIAPLPPLKCQANLAGPDAVVIPKTTPEKQAAAMAFVRYLTSPEVFAHICVELGFLPICRSALEVPEYKAYLAKNPERRALSEAMENLRTKPLHGAWVEIQDALYAARDKVERGKLEPAAACAEAQKAGQAILDRYNASLTFTENVPARRVFHIVVAVVFATLMWLLFHRLKKEYLQLRQQSIRVDWAGYVLVLPQLILFLAFDVFPIGFALYMSFFRWDMLSPRQFAGMGNFIQVVSDPDFIAAFRRTLYWVVGTVPIDTAIALGIALLLNSRVKGIGVFRLLFYTPSVTSGVALAIIWMWILNGHSGLLNYALHLVGVQALLDSIGIGKIDWLGDERFALASLIIMDWWHALAGFLIFLAGLQGIPNMLYEAAEIDGANKWQQFKSITWPLLMPTTFFVLVTAVIGAFQVFEQIYVMTAGEGGPNNSTTTVSFYLYKNAFGWFRMGYASAVAYALGAVVLIITLIQRRYLGKEIEY